MTQSLTPGADLVYVFEGGQMIGSTLASFLGDTVDGLGGVDTISVQSAYPKSYFSLSASADGVLTMTVASGTMKFVNFEKIEFAGNKVVNLGTAGNDSITGTAYNDAFLYGIGGNDKIDGGTGADVMYGGAGNDTYVVDNAGDKPTELAGAGTDTVLSSVDYILGATLENLTLTGSAIKGTGNGVANTITGNAASNILSGAAGNDNIDGGLGNDKIFGGLGLDTMKGGAGSDIFVFNTAPSAANADRILDYNAAADTIQIENGVFTGLGAATGVIAATKFYIGAKAHLATDRMIYNQTTGALYYDADGTGASQQVLVATLTTHPAITKADIVII